VEVVGQQVVPHHELARHAESSEHDGGHPSGAILPARAVVQQWQPARRAQQQPQRGAERRPLPRVRHEPAVHLHHEPSRPPVTEFPALPLMVTAGDQLVDPSEVAAAHRQADGFHPGRQPVWADDQYLARRPEVDDRAQPEPNEPFEIGTGELAERVAAEQPPAPHLQPAGAPVAADVPHVHCAVERDVASWCPLGSHRTRLIAYRLRPPPPQA
jgi:hypothetical protein